MSAKLCGTTSGMSAAWMAFSACFNAYVYIFRTDPQRVLNARILTLSTKIATVIVVPSLTPTVAQPTPQVAPSLAGNTTPTDGRVSIQRTFRLHIHVLKFRFRFADGRISHEI